MSASLQEKTSTFELAMRVVYAGWGHIITEECLRQGLRRKFKTSGLLLPEKSSLKPFNFFNLLHQAAQQRDSYGKVPEALNQEINQALNQLPWLLRLLAKGLRPILEGALRSGEDLSKLERILREHPMLSIAINYLLRELSYLLITKEMVDSLRDQNAGFPTTTYGLTLSGIEEALNIVLDPGFAFKGIEFASQNMLSMVAPGRKQIILAPTDFEAEVLREYYGLEAFNIGTVGQEMTEEEVVKKWQEGKPRIILASTSGNHANLDSLLKIKKDYLDYTQREQKSDYRLVIFLGEHQNSVDERIPQITENVTVIQIEKEEDLEQIDQIIQSSNQPIVVRTKSVELTAKAKLILERLAHIEAVKPGEASFMNPHTATFNYFLRPAGPNEPMNGIWSVVVYRSGIFMPDERWDKFLKDFLDKGIFFFLDRLKGKELLGFASAYIHEIRERINKLREKENFFDQMDSLFEDDFAKKTALEAYCRARNLLVPLRIAIKEIINEVGISNVRDFGEKLREKLKEMVESGEIESNFEKEEKKKRERLFRGFIAIELINHPQLREVMPYFMRLRGEEHLTRENLEIIERKLLELAGFEDMRSFLDTVRQETVTVTFIAGAGTRWIESFKKPENEELIRRYGIKKDEPRAMARVPNLLDPNGDNIPMAAYNLLAVRNLGTKQVIIYGGKTDEEAEKNRRLIEELTQKMGINNVVFIRQKIHPGREKPLGHGDALLQVLDDPQGKKAFENAKYVITNFGCDANSYQTTVLSLLAMYVFDKYGINLSGLMPTSTSESPEYPIYIDHNGLPLGTVHKKDNLPPPEDGESSLQSNVGIRIFRLRALLNVLDRYREIYEKIKQGKDGVDYPNGELKIDHFERDMMSHFASYGVFLTFPISIPEEIAHTPKAIEGIPLWLEGLGMVLEQDRGFKERHGLL